jgi:hypothetical protein
MERLVDIKTLAVTGSHDIFRRERMAYFLSTRQLFEMVCDFSQKCSSVPGKGEGHNSIWLPSQAACMY